MEAFLDKVASLTPKARRIICDKATEPPFSGEYDKLNRQGTYLCRRCGLALFRADDQFSSGCGWPSFDVMIPDAVSEVPDADGLRMEIICQRCQGHLGHVFRGEKLTAADTRYCVNAASLDFVVSDNVLDTQEAIVAGGCFWGVDSLMRQLSGVVQVEVGYTGGQVDNPTYQQVCEGNTGHYEAARILFDPSQVDYAQVLKHFFEIHDPTQANRQGPDIGPQYRSAVFYYDEKQKQHAEDLIQQLRDKGMNVMTKLLPVSSFWPAESYHQQYYEKNQKLPYCHRWVARFD